jgi:hypothetical protein
LGFQTSIEILNAGKAKVFLFSSDFNPTILAKQIVSMIHKQHPEVAVLVIPNMYKMIKEKLGRGFTVISIKDESSYTDLTKWCIERHKMFQEEGHHLPPRTISYQPLIVAKVKNNPHRVQKTQNNKKKRKACQIDKKLVKMAKTSLTFNK